LKAINVAEKPSHQEKAFLISKCIIKQKILTPRKGLGFFDSKL